MPIELLKNLNLIKIAGDDAFTFLQGQLTNDLTQLNDELVWQYSGYCNPKGRLLALLYIWQDDEGYYAILESELREAICKRLQMYVMRSKVTLEHIESAKIYGGRSSAELLEAKLITGSHSAQQSGGLTALQDGWLLSFDQRILYVESQNARTEIDELDSVEPEDSWLNADINDGIPKVIASTTEQFIPQMVNFDQLGGINFKKGCYTGQEIVARMHYLGNLKQRMFYCDIAVVTEENSRAGDKVFAGATEQKTVGNIVSISADSRCALIVLRLDAIDKALLTADGNSITVRNQRFSYQL